MRRVFFRREDVGMMLQESVPFPLLVIHCDYGRWVDLPEDLYRAWQDIETAYAAMQQQLQTAFDAAPIPP